MDWPGTGRRNRAVLPCPGEHPAARPRAPAEPSPRSVQRRRRSGSRRNRAARQLALLRTASRPDKYRRSPRRNWRRWFLLSGRHPALSQKAPDADRRRTKSARRVKKEDRQFALAQTGQEGVQPPQGFQVDGAFRRDPLVAPGTARIGLALRQIKHHRILDHRGRGRDRRCRNRSESFRCAAANSPRSTRAARANRSLSIALDVVAALDVTPMDIPSSLTMLTGQRSARHRPAGTAGASIAFGPPTLLLQFLQRRRQSLGRELDHMRPALCIPLRAECFDDDDVRRRRRISKKFPVRDRAALFVSTC